jgi:hypothetical protein
MTRWHDVDLPRSPRSAAADAHRCEQESLHDSSGMVELEQKAASIAYMSALTAQIFEESFEQRNKAARSTSVLGQSKCWTTCH